MTSNSKVKIELDRDVAEFLVKTGKDALGILLMLGMSSGGSREHNEKMVNGIENWKKVRAAIKDAGVQVIED